MRWKSGRRSTNVEDRRGRRPVSRGVKLGGGAILLALVASLLLGEDPTKILEGMAGSQPRQQTPQTQPAGQPDEASEFVRVVLAETEDVWGAMFAASGQRYPAPKLVLFSETVESACGFTTAATGPFYCPRDRQVYIDLSFYNELTKLGASGDFAFAYVIAHEVGHHIQTVTGISDQVRQMQARASRVQGNQLQVLQELQADCYAGLWARKAHDARNILEEGDIEEGLRAAAAIGDDRLQRRAGRRVQPEAWTHGSSEQRARWLRTGLETGDYRSCDTFAAAGL